LSPPTKFQTATGALPRLPFRYVEDGRTFDFVLSSDALLALPSHGGFFAVAAGTAVDAAAVDGRALFWVDSSTQPWTLALQQTN
jgi:hypothetical protein